MDKITKNPDTAKLTDSPRTSNANPQIERYRIEISKKSESDFINTRKLTIQSPVHHEPPPESYEIDKQISELECLIKRLQDEIVEMSNNCDKLSLLPEDDDAPPVENYGETPTMLNEDKSPKSKNNADTNQVDTTNHVYPVVVKDVGVNLDEQSKTLNEQISDLVNYSGSKEMIPESFSSIQKNFDVLWNSEGHDPDSKDAKDDYHLQKLISDLKTEISEKLETLKDVDIGEPTNDSENMNIPNEN